MYLKVKFRVLVTVENCRSKELELISFNIVNWEAAQFKANVSTASVYDLYGFALGRFEVGINL